MLHRPGANPRARNSSASQLATPAAFGSRACGSDGPLAIRQRIRAPLRFGVPCSRTNQQGTCLCSAATASRRVAVKSRLPGSPQISPTTALRDEHRRPSSIAHKASRASRASTWMRPGMASLGPSPAGWTRPASMIAIRSWTQSKGLPASICGNRKPVQPPSRGLAGNNSERVGRAGLGKHQCPCEGRDPDARSAPTASPDWAPAFAGEQVSAARRPAPATRDKPLATRLATFVLLLFFYPDSGRESQVSDSG
jgi:hypothetical protein